jgi:single-strand DNA-binding protein
MSSFNKVSLFGNVGKDADVKHLDGGKIVAKFSLTTTENRGKGEERTTETTWHNIVVWDKLAELAEKYIKKGMAIIIEGKISNRSYVNKDGQTVYTSEIIAKEIYFTGKKETDSAPLENKEGQFQKGGKVTTGAMSDINDLPGVNDELSNIPF